MKEGSTRRISQSLSKRMISLGMALGLMTITLLGTGCDTVALIAFPERSFSTVVPVSVMPGGGQCGGISGDATMKMVFMANDDTPIKPGEAVSLTTVDLDRDDFSFSDGRLYSFPDQRCEGGECPSAFTCSPSVPGAEGLGDRCSNASGLTVSGEPRFVGEDHQAQAHAVVMSQDGRWRGWFAEDLGSLRMVDEDGEEIRAPDRSTDSDRAVDPTLDRFGAIRQLRSVWGNLMQNVEADGRTAYFGLWSFADSVAEVESHIGALSADASPWSRQAGSNERVSEAIGQMDSQPAQVRSNVYRSLQTILRQGFIDSPAVASATSRSITLIVPGHDERREAQVSVDQIIEKANDLGVSISVVQVDAPMDVDVLRDDYRYYESQPACTDNSECKNFEECRQPQFFRAGASGTSITHPSDTEANYCLPARDENGRIGPVHDYQRMACETGGAYSYIPILTNDLLFSRIRGLAMAPEGGWEVDFVIDEAAGLFPEQPFLMQGSLDVSIGQVQSYEFSQWGARSGSAALESRDTRPVFFSPAD